MNIRQYFYLCSILLFTQSNFPSQSIDANQGKIRRLIFTLLRNPKAKTEEEEKKELLQRINNDTWTQRISNARQAEPKTSIDQNEKEPSPYSRLAFIAVGGIGTGIFEGFGTGAGAAAGTGAVASTGLGAGTAGAGVLGGILSGPVLPGIVVGAGLLWLTKEILQSSRGSGGGGGGGGSPDDPEDKDKKNKENKAKYPNGIYEPNPKHHKNSRGNIGKEPRNGQDALNKSVEVPSKLPQCLKERSRVAVQDNQFIMFRPHVPGKYHAYVVEKFHDLPRAARNALTNAGIIKNPKSGKI